MSHKELAFVTLIVGWVGLLFVNGTVKTAKKKTKNNNRMWPIRRFKSYSGIRSFRVILFKVFSEYWWHLTGTCRLCVHRNRRAIIGLLNELFKPLIELKRWNEWWFIWVNKDNRLVDLYSTQGLGTSNKHLTGCFFL